MAPPATTRNNSIRALKACESCRRQKTRCYPSDDPTGACLRCLSVGRDCSFIQEGAPPRPSHSLHKLSADGEGIIPHVEAGPGKSYKRHKTDEMGSNERKRIKETHHNVKKIIQLLSKTGIDLSSMTESAGSFNTRSTISAARPLGADSNGTASITVSPNQTSPFQVIKSSISDGEVPIAIEHILAPPSGLPLEEEEPPNILSLGIIALKDVIALINRFKEGYGKWISLPNIKTEDLIQDLKFKSPILLTAICLTSLRYNITRTRTKDEESLQRQLSIRLGQELNEFLTSPNEFKSIEFLQALVILSVHGFSLTNEEINVDPWFLSGLAIQWFLTLDINREFLTGDKNDDTETDLAEGLNKEEDQLSVFRIWNHLCLVHLSNSVFSGRMCVLDEIRLNQTRKSLELTQTKNFDGRMIAEISLQLLLYNFIQSTTIESNDSLDNQFEVFEEDIKQWSETWEYLFKQPEEQFVEFGFNYSYVVALYHYKLGNVSLLDVKPNDEEHIIEDFEILNKILYHSLKVMNHILKIKNVDLFVVLSDQIHFCLFYVSIVFLKVIRWIDIVDKGETYEKHELDNFVDKVDSIRAIYSKISKVENDLAHKYSESLQFGIDETKEFIHIG